MTAARYLEEMGCDERKSVAGRNLNVRRRSETEMEKVCRWV